MELEVSSSRVEMITNMQSEGGVINLKKNFNVLSVILFGFNLVVYVLFFNGFDIVPDEALFPLTIGVSIIAVILSWFGRKGFLRNIGIFLNVFILLFTVIGPIIVRTFIWNSP